MRYRTAVLGWLGLLAACGGEGSAARSAPRSGGIAELDALLQQNRGRGVLVNLWATW